MGWMGKSKINCTIYVKVAQQLCKFKHQLCFEQELLPHLEENSKKFALFSDKFTQLYKNLITQAPSVAAIVPNINFVLVRVQH